MIAAHFLLLLASSAVLALPNNLTSIGSCGAYKDPADIVANEELFRAALVNMTDAERISSDRIVAIPVIWHVITKNGDITGGNIPDGVIAASISATNQHYGNTPFRFTISSVTRTQDPHWFGFAKPGSDADRVMKQVLHQGGPNVLNVYSVGFEDSEIGGYSSFPYDFQNNPVDDGVVVIWSSFPGGPLSQFNQGKILTHEIGHWLGLFHTYEGRSCGGPGDFVDDTPAQAVMTLGCPGIQDSCPGGGPDPINNFMDSSFDICRNIFTPGQITRAVQQVRQFRGIIV